MAKDRSFPIELNSSPVGEGINESVVSKPSSTKEGLKVGHKFNTQVSFVINSCSLQTILRISAKVVFFNATM